MGSNDKELLVLVEFHLPLYNEKEEILNWNFLFFYLFKKSRLFFLAVTVTAHELINTTCCIHQCRFTSIERVRSIRDFYLQ